MEKEISILISPTTPSIGVRSGEDIGGGFGAAIASGSMRLITVGAEALRDQITNLVEVVEFVFDRAAPSVNLEQIELSIEITAEGKVSLLGTGANGGGRGAIKMIFKRNDPGSGPRVPPPSIKVPD